MGYTPGIEVDNAGIVWLGVEVGIGEGEGIDVTEAVIVGVVEGVDTVTIGDGTTGVLVKVG
jgi:hypothetical protein